MNWVVVAHDVGLARGNGTSTLAAYLHNGGFVLHNEHESLLLCDGIYPHASSGAVMGITQRSVGGLAELARRSQEAVPQNSLALNARRKMVTES
jgi:hypothetical protein